MEHTKREPGRIGHRIGMGILLFVSVVLVLFGVGDIRQGQDADPAIANAHIGKDWEQVKVDSPDEARLIDLHTRAGGLHLVVMGLLAGLVTWMAFRKGERWAWFALWLLPAWSFAVFLMNFLSERSPDFPPPPPMISGPIFAGILVLGLALSARRFFGKRTDAAA